MPILKDLIETIEISPGVDKDNSPLSTQHYTDSSNIRFYNGKPEKLGGNIIFTTDGDISVSGCARLMYSQLIQNRIHSLIGTNTHLYDLFSTGLINITPLVTATIAIANSLDSHFQTLVNDPIDTVISSSTLTINSTAHILIAGDIVTLSGAVGFNGIPTGEINVSHIVRSITVNSYTVIVTTSASGTGSGGGGVVVEATKIVTVNQVAHGYADFDRIKILAATAFAGIPDIDLNKEHIIRNTQTNTYDILVNTTATSSATGGGGAATTVQGQIPIGACDQSIGIGYGVGKYGVGKYGISKTSVNIGSKPRIYSADRFGNNVVLTPGGQTGLYIWDSDINIAPILVANAPLEINYVFVYNNIIVTFGANGQLNRVQWSDIANATVWTPTEINQAGEVDVETADIFLCHSIVSDAALLFTESKVFAMRYINLPLIWAINDTGASDGIISQRSKVVYNNICFWQGNDDFYMYNGGVIQSIPSNSSNRINYIKNFVFDNLNQSQKSKCFAWFNERFKEIWFHYPSGTSNECDKVAKFNVEELHWTVDNIDRTTGETPIHASDMPFMIDTDNNIRKHEIGVNDDTLPLEWFLDSPTFQVGNRTVLIEGVIPDSIQTGNIDIETTGRREIQDSSTDRVESATVSPTKGIIKYKPVSGRNWRYSWSSSELDGNWRMGTWYQLVKGSTPK